MATAKTYNFDPHGASASKLQEAIQAQLVTFLGDDVALDALAQFIVQLVSRSTDASTVCQNIVEFLDEQSDEFTEWLFQHLESNQELFVDDAAAYSSVVPAGVLSEAAEPTEGHDPGPRTQRSNSLKSSVGAVEASADQQAASKAAADKRKREPISWQPQKAEPLKVNGDATAADSSHGHDSTRSARFDQEPEGRRSQKAQGGEMRRSSHRSHSPVQWRPARGAEDNQKTQDRALPRRSTHSRSRSRSRSPAPEPKAADRSVRAGAAGALFRHAVGHAVRDGAGPAGLSRGTSNEHNAVSDVGRAHAKQGGTARQPSAAAGAGESAADPMRPAPGSSRGVQQRDEEAAATGPKRSVFERLRGSTAETQTAAAPVEPAEKRARMSVFERLGGAGPSSEVPAAQAAREDARAAVAPAGMNGSHSHHGQGAARGPKRPLVPDSQAEERAAATAAPLNPSPAKRVKILPGGSLSMTITAAPSTEQAMPAPTTAPRPSRSTTPSHHTAAEPGPSRRHTAAAQLVPTRTAPTGTSAHSAQQPTASAQPAAAAAAVAAPVTAVRRTSPVPARSSTPPKAAASAGPQVPPQVAQQRIQLAKLLAAKERELSQLAAKCAYNPQDEVDSRTVVVMNVHTATEEVLLDHFEACGKVRRVNVTRNPATGAPTGHAHIEFANRLSVAKALQLAGSSILGRPIRVIEKNPGGVRVAAAAPSRPAKPVVAAAAAPVASTQPSGTGTATGGRTYTWKRGGVQVLDKVPAPAAAADE